MKIGKTIIRVSQSGWVVYHNNDVTNFVTFRSNEPRAFLEYVAKHIADVSLDRIAEERMQEIERMKAKLETKI